MKPDTPKLEMPDQIRVVPPKLGAPKNWWEWSSDPDTKGVLYIRADLAAAPKPDCEVSTTRRDNADQEYESFWKEIVETDGVLDLEKVKLELYDFSWAMREVPKVYMHITGGLLSKIMYEAQTVIAEADDYYERCFEEDRKSEQGDGKQDGWLVASEALARINRST